MNFDVERHLSAVTRSVSSMEREGKPARAVTLARSYDTTIDDLWDAVTNSERLSRWYAPVSGDLELGGRYQVEGNAGGVITACVKPSHLALTWEFGGETSWVEVHLTAEGADRARLTLTHTAPVSEHWSQYGPGAVGVGWELSFLGLAFHLARPTDPRVDEAAFSASSEGRSFIMGSSEGWGQATIAAGTDPEAARAAAERTAAFYTGAPTEPA